MAPRLPAHGLAGSRVAGLVVDLRQASLLNPASAPAGQDHLAESIRAPLLDSDFGVRAGSVRAGADTVFVSSVLESRNGTVEGRHPEGFVGAAARMGSGISLLGLGVRSLRRGASASGWNLRTAYCTGTPHRRSDSAAFRAAGDAGILPVDVRGG